MPDLKIKDIITRSFVMADTGMPLQALQRQMSDEDCEAVIFQDKSGKIKGVAGKERILQLKGRQKEPACGILGLSEPVTVSEEMDIDRVMPLMLEGKGGILATDRDGRITGVSSAETILKKLLSGWQKSQALLDTVLMYASEAVCVINGLHEVEYWNPKAEALYGIRRKDILGRTIDNFFSNLLVSLSLRDGKVFRELYHQPREGAHVLITATPVLVGDRVIGGLSLERDIGDVVYLNEELSRTSFKAGFLRKEISSLRSKNSFAKIYGHSKIIKETIEMAKKYAATETTVLITGESGSGKELFARAIHEESSRNSKPFVAVNCGAVPQALFESEVFGYEGGAFTGALKEGKPGKFEMADGGTLFLDEIGELEPGVQVKLLRALQEKSIYRVGATKPIAVDVRIVAATNCNLEKMIKRGLFREDLYYRLNVITLALPTLRDRRQDLPELTYLLTQELALQHNKKIMEFDPRVMAAFMIYHWPGNVRELRNVLERMVILEEDGVIGEANLPDFLRFDARPDQAEGKADLGISLAEATGRTERQMIEDALARVSGNKAMAARLLGIPRSSLYYRMKVLGLVTKI